MGRLFCATTLLVIVFVSQVHSQGGRLTIPPQLLFEFLRSMPRDPVFCNFVCPLGSGTSPSPRPDHVPRYNGCGSYGFERLLIPDVEPFVDCCNAHDICYDTCGASKNMCDMQFQQCLNQRCSNGPATTYQGTDLRLNARVPPGGLMHACLSTARLLGSGPVLAGCAAYMAAQNSACVCTAPSNAF